MERKCETIGHEDRSGAYKVEGSNACSTCYKRAKRGPDYVSQKPGRKPDPTRPGSRYNPDSKHYLGKNRRCASGHVWLEGSYVTRSDGKRVCLSCIADRKGETCPLGLHLRSEHENQHGACRPCAAKRQYAYRLMAKYRLTPEQFDTKLIEQGGRCAICMDEFDFEKHGGVCVDHDHACCPGERTCGECLRSILCGECNKGLGNFKDSSKIISNARAYVRRWALERK